MSPADDYPTATGPRVRAILLAMGPDTRLNDAQSDGGGKPRILVVDDEPAVLSMCQRALELAYDPVCVATSEAAIEQMQDQPFTLIIVDQALPRISGIELLSQSLSLQPNAGRIVITGHDDQSAVVAAINTGRAHAFITKPWNHTAFMRVLERETRVAAVRMQVEHEHSRYQRLLYDARTDLPTRQLVQETAVEWLREAGFLGVLVIDASELWSSQAEFGREVFCRVEQELVGCLKSLQGSQYRQEDLLAIDEVESAFFCIFLAQPRRERVSCARDVRAIAQRLQDELTTAVARMNLPLNSCWPGIAVGHGFVLHNPHISSTYQLHHAMTSARDDARRKLESDDRVTRKSQLERIIVNQLISSVFQPIINLTSQELLGYEALSRGPAQTEFESPLFLLRVADRAGLTVELDRVFRTMALRNAVSLPSDSAVFINTLPSTLYDPDLSAGRLKALLEELRLSPERLVFEFSERYVVHNRDLVIEAVNRHRELGIKLAIDDVGAGYSGLERIASLQPDYLKIDGTLVRDIDGQSVKRSVFKALVHMASEIGAEVIAECIETQAERDCLVDLGVRYGQGFLIGRPAPPAEAA